MTDARSDLRVAYLERRADLVRFFAVRLRSPAAAEDLVQDIYLRLETVDPSADVKNAAGYLYRLGSNLMLDRLRGERRAAVRDHEWRESHHTIIGTDEVSEAPRADDAVAARQRLEAIVALVEEMPETTRKVFRLHKFDGLNHAEVAQALGISRSAVEKHVMAVLKRLAERLR
ncbi:MAG: RNA polymerase sigma factor [Phenylobacterium sp.]|uniref:RNA polymerase sigma factor n=1 Tax=Phenylobacterium sp. TaxID=1871053 RepID=UPI0025FA89B5|nr:RNA polymerase sigma factor [Phenylobacterium sp.]MBT9470822.1 RNA polymerase sigma factor [Phenylobacterium sp.]